MKTVREILISEIQKLRDQAKSRADYYTSREPEMKTFNEGQAAGMQKIIDILEKKETEK